MSKKLQDILRKARQGHAYKREKIVLALTEEMIALMELQNINKSDLADRLGCSKPYVTKILSGTANFTLDTMIQMADALNSELNIHLTSQNCETQWIDFKTKPSSAIIKSTPTWEQWESDEFFESSTLAMAL